MGNTPSKEPQPQGRSSHKLSKPRVASFQTAATAPSKSTTVGQTSPGQAAHEFKSIPYTATSTNSSAVQPGTAESHDFNNDIDNPTPLVGPKAQRRRSLFRSKSSRESPDRKTSRRNSIIGTTNLSTHGEFGPVLRANSISTNHASDQWHRGLPLPVNEKYVAPSSKLSGFQLT